MNSENTAKPQPPSAADWGADTDLEFPTGLDAGAKAEAFAALFAPVQTVPMRRFDAAGGRTSGDGDSAQQRLNAEAPVALVCNGIAWAVMMATPAAVVDFALGFAMSEGVIDTPADCYGITARALPSVMSGLPADLPAIEVSLDIASRCMQRLSARRRALSGRTGCGVCGIESIQSLDLQDAAPAQITWTATLDDAQMATIITRAMAALPAAQRLRQAAGAIHAAAWADLQGRIVHTREDIGRHNALDKLIGALARAHAAPRSLAPQPQMPARPPSPALADLRGVALMSSRASHELIRKCARVGLGVLATAAAPTHLAVALAREHGVQLWAQCRADSATRYA